MAITQQGERVQYLAADGAAADARHQYIQPGLIYCRHPETSIMTGRPWKWRDV
jgi:hypothetical protein